MRTLKVWFTAKKGCRLKVCFWGVSLGNVTGHTFDRLRRVMFIIDCTIQMGVRVRCGDIVGNGRGHATEIDRILWIYGRKPTSDLFEPPRRHFEWGCVLAGSLSARGQGIYVRALFTLFFFSEASWKQDTRFSKHVHFLLLDKSKKEQVKKSVCSWNDNWK